MGVFLVYHCTLHHRVRLPHARGGVSQYQGRAPVFRPSSPRPWGCFAGQSGDGNAVRVFPTPVGVFLCPARDYWTRWRLPHARGGVSHLTARSWASVTSSPRPWGCFHLVDGVDPRLQVFPTPVGVFPAWGICSIPMLSLPHARGGVSSCLYLWGPSLASSPRPWGCFHARIVIEEEMEVFPTLVGVFPPSRASIRPTLGLPHARGGVSGWVPKDKGKPWVFPTPVGVFPDVKVQGTPASASDSANERRLCLRGGRLLRSRMNIFKPKTL